ncbi:hypothetical protein ACW9H6_29280, partial [Pseudomonas sp. SDO528_S397]
MVQLHHFQGHDPGNYVVQVLFHFFVGLLMAIVLVKLAADYFVKSAWYVGLVAAIIVWTMNAAVILPLLGEGVAGSRTVSVMGIIYFAVAHTAFFITLSLRARRLVMQSSIWDCQIFCVRAGNGLPSG